MVLNLGKLRIWLFHVNRIFMQKVCIIVPVIISKNSLTKTNAPAVILEKCMQNGTGESV